ncbi:sulfatase-like hydrolase/transferase [Halorubrum ezzemoulense]|uniref:sulfatase-like hydrolase/transferase n=1 Tax=Halorubrum ezzemoulense TaxID=337243 RepID=UPI00232AE124|nr:sulfatase-like hydrolase/transferase [Halorubrum ezzemoulense]MDB9235524.1 sulfatase-like hydrolase/transferase [Halorubrum ezzemoulense]
MNVILITIDSMRFGAISELSNSDDVVTPFLDQKVRQGATFMNAFATGSGTSTSFPGILGGVLPFDFGYPGLSNHNTPIAEVLKNDGISTIGISGNIATSRVYSYDRGFTSFHDTVGNSLKDNLYSYILEHNKIFKLAKKTNQIIRSIKPSLESNSVPYIRAEDLNDIAVDMIEDCKDPYFAWLHYMDPHHPYSPPQSIFEEFDTKGYEIDQINELVDNWSSRRPELSSDNKNDSELFTSTEMEAIKETYNAEMAYVDSQIEALYKKITKSKDTEETIFIVCGDHGEEFLEHGHFSHRPKLFNELIHVPLILFSNKDKFNTSISNPVSLSDIPPTVSRLFDSKSNSTWRGMPLTSKDLYTGRIKNQELEERDYIFSELAHEAGLGEEQSPEIAKISVVKYPWKYIYYNKNNAGRLYNIRDDPHETEAVLNEEVTDELHEQAQTRLSTLADGPHHKTENQSTSSTAVQDRLEALGYKE